MGASATGCSLASLMQNRLCPDQLSSHPYARTNQSIFLEGAAADELMSAVDENEDNIDVSSINTRFGDVISGCSVINNVLCISFTENGYQIDRTRTYRVRGSHVLKLYIAKTTDSDISLAQQYRLPSGIKRIECEYSK